MMKNHKKFPLRLLAVVLAVMLALGSGTVALGEGEPARLVLSADLDKAAHGETVTVTVALENLTDPVDMIGFRLLYDPEVFELVGQPEFDGGMSVFSDKSFGTSTAGRVTVTVCAAPELGDSLGNRLSDGAVCTIELKVKDAAAVGQTELSFDSQHTRLGYLDGQGLPVLSGCAGQGTAVRVYIPITGITLSQKVLEIDEGKTAQLSATVSPGDTTEDATVTWSSDNEAVATVDQAGTVTAVGGGTANITATAGGFSQSCTVTVIPDFIPGDTDGDGEITDWDGVILDRYLAGWDVEVVIEAADYDGDGEVTDWDAIELNRYLAGW